MQIKLLALIIALFLPNMVFCKPLLIKCNETTGTRRFDIFKINNPEFFWYYENEWYELAVSNEGVAKDWKVDVAGIEAPEKLNIIQIFVEAPQVIDQPASSAAPPDPEVVAKAPSERSSN